MDNGCVDHWFENVCDADVFGLENTLFDALVDVGILVPYPISEVCRLPAAKVKTLVALDLGPRRAIRLKALQNLLVVPVGKGSSLSPTGLSKRPRDAEPREVRHFHPMSTAPLDGEVIKFERNTGGRVLARQSAAFG